MAPQLLSVNVGRPQTVPRGSGTARTAIWKHPVAGPVAARGVNLEGDDQADRSVHGGPDKAIYAYASEDARATLSSTGVGARQRPGDTRDSRLSGASDDAAHDGFTTRR